MLGQETLFSVDGRDFNAQVAKVYPQVTNGTFKVDFYFDGAGADRHSCRPGDRSESGAGRRQRKP